MEELKSTPFDFQEMNSTPNKLGPERSFPTSPTFSFDSMKQNLRKLIGAGERNRLRYFISEIEKKSTELEMAKYAVKHLEDEMKATGSVKIMESDEDKKFENQARDNEKKTMQYKKQVEACKLEYNISSPKSAVIEAPSLHVAQLQEKIETLTADLHKSNFSFEKQRQAASAMEEHLNSTLKKIESDLYQSNCKIKQLEVDIDMRRADYAIMNASLQLERHESSRKHAELMTCTRMKNEVVEKLEEAREEAAEVDEQITKLADVLGKENPMTVENQLETAIKQEEFLRHKCESRFEIINNGVQNIIRDFHAVKAELIQNREKVSDLEIQLRDSIANVKYYKNDAANVRKFCNTIETEVMKVLKTGQKDTSEAEQKFKELKLQLDDTEQLLTTVTSPVDERAKQLEHEIILIKQELEDQLKSGEVNSVVDAIKSLKESYRLSLVGKTYKSDSGQYDKESWEKIIAQNTELEKEVKRLQVECENSRIDFIKTAEAEKTKMEEEICSLKTLVKKVRKERDLISKRVKRQSEGTRQAEHHESSFQFSPNTSKSNSKTPDASDCSDRSVSDEYVFEKPEDTGNNQLKIEELEESLKKETASVDFHRKAMSLLEYRFSEQQRSSHALQKRFNTELETIRKKLEASEAALGAQQELNAKQTVLAEDLQQKYEIDVADHMKNYQQLEETCKQATAKMEELKNTRVDFVKSVEGDLETARAETREALNELMLCRVSFEDSKYAAEDVNAELSKVKKLMLTRTEELNKAKKQNSELLTKIKQLNSEVEEAQALLREQEDSYSETDSTTSEEVEKLKLDVAELVEKNEHMKKQVAELAALQQSENNSLIVKMTELKHKLEEEERLTRSLRIRIHELEVKNVQLQGFEVLWNAEKQKCDDLRRELDQSETEVKKFDSMQQMTNELEKTIVSKDVLIKEHVGRNDHLVLTVSRLESELEDVVKLKGIQSPNKDKELQLEKRLEVMQNSAQARCKRYEEDLKCYEVELSRTKEELEVSLKEKERLSEQAEELASKIENLSVSRKAVDAELVKLIENEEAAKRKFDAMDVENKQERACLVDELIEAKEKLEKFQSLAERHTADIEQIRILENRLTAAETQSDNRGALRVVPETTDQIDKAFPTLDPAVRQFIRLVAKNHNLAYGLGGCVAYIFLIHLYLFL